jgi:hypothetical protein
MRVPLIEPHTITDIQVKKPIRQPRNDEELVAALRREPVGTDRCLVCSAVDDLVHIDFGLAKVKKSRKWNETIASLIFSAISVPLGGYGLIRIPGKSTETEMFTLRLLLCRNCFSEYPDYSLHPWFSILWEYGYNQFVSPAEIAARNAHDRSK